MRNRSLIVGLVAALAGVVVWVYSSSQFQQIVVTARAVTPAVRIPTYTVITPDMLTTRDVPRSMLSEPIYVDAKDLIGKIATADLAPNIIIYREFVVPMSEFRLTGDPSLEVVSFPVSPESAVGGQVRVGHLINIYRAIVSPDEITRLAQESDLSIDALINIRAAAVELLAGDVPVVGVYSGTGAPALSAESPVSGADAASPARTPGGPLQILTVAVRPETAPKIVQLVAEGKAQIELWVSLAPVGGAAIAQQP